MAVPDLERCLQAIRDAAPEHAAVRGTDAWAREVGTERWVYVNDPPRETCAEGEVYVTFIVYVAVPTGLIRRVTRYRSRKGAAGDDTLPP